jgi:integrase
MENDLITKNPAILVRNSAETSTTKAIYIPKAGFEKIVDALPSWYKPIAWTAFYTGMRQGEIRNLNRSQLNLDRRIIELSSADTKEGRSKKIPIHKDLVPILRIIGIDTVFLRDGQPIARTQMRRYWEKACREAGYPGFRFHGIRHIWKTNARASGINGEIRRAIMGHSERRGSVHERYGPKVMKEYLEAVDMMEFDHSGDKASSG